MTSLTPAKVDDADRGRIIVGVLICMLLAALDQTIIAPVIPTLGASLGGADYISWIVSAYFLTATAVTPLYGKIADINGRRPTLMAAIAIFVAGSTICALAPSMGILILGRAIQGIGGGGLMALAQTVIGDLMPPRERGTIAGYIAIMWGTASIAGPVLGGLIADRFSWTLIFWLNLPLAAAAVALSNRALQRLPWQRRDHKLDIAGSILVVVATVMFMLALALAPQPRFGWRSPIVLGLALMAIALCPVIHRHMQDEPEPLIPFEVLRNRVVLMATSSVFFGMAANIGLSVFVPLFLENALGLSASSAGLALVALMMGTVLGANIAGRTLASFEHYKRLPMVGLAIAAVALVYVALRVQTIGLWPFEVLLFVIGAGLGAQFPMSTVCVQNAVDTRDIGVATGIMAFMRALGSSLGVAVVGAVGAASGIAINGGAHDGAAAIGTSAANALAAANFGPVFIAAAICMAISFAILSAMPELPLRAKNN